MEVDEPRIEICECILWVYVDYIDVEYIHSNMNIHVSVFLPRCEHT